MAETVKKNTWPWYVRFRRRLSSVLPVFRKGIAWYDRKLRKFYSPNVAALTGTMIVFVIACILLFLPPLVGMADDGSLTEIMHETGLGYRPQDLEFPTGSYFTRLYLHSTRQSDGWSSHQAVIRIAMWFDDLFTKDNLFDIRFLSGIYLLLYLPAVWLLLRGIAGRVKRASEATFLTILSAFVLGDAQILSYLNSLYPEAMWQIFLVYIVGFCLALQYGRKEWSQTALIGIAAAGCIFVFVETHCAPCGFILAIFCIRQLVIEKGNSQMQILSVMAASVLVFASLASWNTGTDRFTGTSRLHAMTNGVLMRANDPEKVLAQFGIEQRFETLTDVSAYADYPYALAGNPEIVRGFLDKYSPATVTLYYIRNPLAYAGLLELGTRASFRSARDYVGNYEKSTGLPERARNPLFIMYSMFKSGSLPQTMGFLAIMAVVYLVMFRPRKGLQARTVRWTPRERQIALDTFFCCWLIGILHISTVIILSGTAELERYQLIYGSCINFMLLLFLSEILHRLNILSDEE